MDRLVLPENALNGGFPEPPAGAPVRIVAARHDACGASTRVRLPASVPPSVVRRFHCAGCAAAFEAQWVEEVELRTAADEAPVKPAPVEPPREAVLPASGELTTVDVGNSTLDRGTAAPAAARPEPAPEPEVPLEVSLMGLIKRTGPVAPPEPAPVAPPKPAPPAVEPEPVAPEPEPVVLVEPELEAPAFVRAKPVAPAPEPAAIPESELVVAGPEQDAIEALTVEAPVAKPKSKLIAALTAKRSLSKPKLTTPKGPKVAAPSRPAISLPTLKRPSLTMPSLDPDSRSWKLLSIPIAAALVIIGLLVLRGGGEDPTIAVAPPAAEANGNHAAGAAGAADGKEHASDTGGDKGSKPSKDTQFVSESLYSLAMPAGWERIDPPAGATFAAVATDAGADATLWIKEDPKLDYPTFISQSLAQLETLAGNAEIIERIPGPTAESTTVRLAADAPPGMPTYEVTLRVAGPYRFYLATSVQPDASGEAADGADLVAGSLTPELEG